MSYEKNYYFVILRHRKLLVHHHETKACTVENAIRQKLYFIHSDCVHVHDLMTKCTPYHSANSTTDGIGLELAIEPACYLVNLRKLEENEKELTGQLWSYKWTATDSIFIWIEQYCHIPLADLTFFFFFKAGVYPLFNWD